MKSALVSLFIATTSFAGSATWNLSPPSNDWNTAANWSPETVPNDPADIATFDVSNQTALAISQLTTVDRIVFNPSASAFTVTAAPTQALVFAGAGLTNSSPLTQNFVTAVDELGNRGLIQFTGSSRVTGPVIFTNHGSISGLSDALDGETQFFDSSSAGDGNFFNLGDENGGGGAVFYGNANAGSGDFFNVGANSHTYFYDTSNAAQGRFLNAAAGFTYFTDSATAGDGIFVNDQGGVTQFAGTIGAGTGSSGGNGVYVNNGTATADQSPGVTLFSNHSDAGNGTYIANSGGVGFSGGLINFTSDATGGNARMILHGNGSLDISLHQSGITIGSLSGNGLVFLGKNTLTVGADNSSTSFTGVIQDGGNFDLKGGVITKTGAGTLTLSGANLYRGGTRVRKGRLWVNNQSGSGTGTGMVVVDGGTLGGRGTINGSVTIGAGTGAGGVLAPGNRGGRPNVLGMLRTLTFNSDSTYKVGLDTRTVAIDQISANGVTIGSGAQFSFNTVGGQPLGAGTVFTTISNTSPNPISGTFTNLPDGGTIIVGSNTFQASYEGGDGNDLTLTVVP